MPQATDELRAQWPGGDRQAINHLLSKGFQKTDDFRWVLPYTTYNITDRDYLAIEYLVAEWDYGALSINHRAPEKPVYHKPTLSSSEQYAFGLFVEESGEVNRLIGKALRFGLDMPGRLLENGEPDFSFTPREELYAEVGDVVAAIRMLYLYGILEMDRVEEFAAEKYFKFITEFDATGRALAPPVTFPVYSPDGEIWIDKEPKAQPKKSWRTRLRAWWNKSPQKSDDTEITF